MGKATQASQEAEVPYLGNEEETLQKRVDHWESIGERYHRAAYVGKAEAIQLWTDVVSLTQDNTQLRSERVNAVQAQESAQAYATLLLSVSAITVPRRCGLYCTLAIVEPKWCPREGQLLSQKPTSGAPGRGRQVRRCPRKNAHFVPQNNLHLAKTTPTPSQNGPTKGNNWYRACAP